MDELKIIWQPAWFELDQAIAVGLVDDFWLIKDSNNDLKFHHGLDPDTYEVLHGQIKKISHKFLGDIYQIETDGLSYTITLNNGKKVVLDAEENPGKIENNFPAFETDNFIFTVELTKLHPTNAPDT